MSPIWGSRRKKRNDTSLSYWPDRPDEVGVLYPPLPAPGAAPPLPVPPEELRLGYADYEQSGERSVGRMRAILKDAGHPVEEGRRILDFGCAAGRMIRALRDLADAREIWGCDVSGAHVAWCREHLEPPFHFFSSTLVPHLPFEDRSFDLVYAASVFTHLEDTAESWFLELHRVLGPGKILFATIHDRRTMELLDGKWKEHPFARKLREIPEYAALARGPFGMFSIRIPSGRVKAMQCNVFHDVEYLRRRVAPLFDVAAVVPEGDNYQTALVMRRR